MACGGGRGPVQGANVGRISNITRLTKPQAFPAWCDAGDGPHVPTALVAASPGGNKAPPKATLHPDKAGSVRLQRG